ncbi:unnamed protein product [Sphagnum jensenii]|jgi:hypothetical protein|uniref:Uncharacterized protein n=1 Tax=Sphagnum jensenii TaxID=128206 RepID=A0ABP0XH76_9BRYO
MRFRFLDISSVDEFEALTENLYARKVDCCLNADTAADSNNRLSLRLFVAGDVEVRVGGLFVLARCSQAVYIRAWMTGVVSILKQSVRLYEAVRIQ